MPWQAGDARSHTHKAKSAAQQTQWAKVANAILARTGDDAKAIRIANAGLLHSAMKRSR
jgi:hypothetical protein